MVTLFDKFLRIVPGTARIGHKNRQDEPGPETADQQSHHSGYAENKSGQHRCHNSQDRRQQHLSLRAFGRNLDTPRIIGGRLAFENPFDFTELAAHLLDHALRRTAHGIHRKAAEQEGHHRSDKHPDQYVGVHHRNVVIIDEIEDIRIGNRFHRTVRQRN